MRSIGTAYLNFGSGNSGVVLDASADGLGFQAVDPLKINESNSLQLSVSGFRSFNLSGRVVWLDETQRRGGMRILVPVDQRQMFQRWLQQHWIPSSAPDPPSSSANSTDLVLPETPEKESRIGRNVLAGCLVLTLCVAVVAGSDVLKATRRIGDLVLHHRPVPSAQAATGDRTVPQSSSSEPGDPSRRAASADSRVPHSRAEHNHSAPTGQKNIYADRAARATSAVSPSANSRPAALLAQSSAPAMSETLRGANSLPDSSDIVPLSKPQPPLPASAVPTGAHAPGSATTVAANRNLVANSQRDMNGNSRKAASEVTGGSGPPVHATQAPEALNSQPPGPEAKLEPCHLVRSVQPAYPDEARRERVQGDVKMRVVVGADGTVRSVVPLDGPPLLVAAAVNATFQFHYKPALLNGQPIETIQTIDISFKLQP